MNRQEIRAAIAIAVLFLVRMLGLFMILPVLPLLVDEMGTPFLIGVAIGIYGLSQAVLQIPMGLASDRYSRKLVITVGLGIFILGSLVGMFADDMAWIILARFLQGCGAIASTLFALVSDVTRIEHRSKAMAIIGAGIGVSFGVAIVIGPLIASYFGLSGIFAVSALMGGVGIALLWTIVPTPVSIRTNLDTGVVVDKLKNTLLNTSLMPVNFGVFFLHYFLTSSFLVFPLMFRALGIDDQSHSMYYLGILLGSILLMVPFVWLSDRKGKSRIVMQGMIFTLSLGMLGLAVVEDKTLVVASMVVFFIAFNLLETTLPAHMSRVVPAGTRGTGMGVYSSFQYLGTLFGGIVGGTILAYGDITAVMYVNAGIGIVWFLLSFSLHSLNDIESRTISLQSSVGSADNKVLEGLLSVPGVLDVVILEQERIAYLKIDSTSFKDADIQQFTR